MAKTTRPAARKAAAKKTAKAPTTKVTKSVADTPEALAAHKASLGKKIRVRATQTGFIDNVRRRAGDVFDVREGEFSEKWMETVDGSTPKKATGAQASLTAHHDDVVAERLSAKTGAPAKSTGDKDVLS